MFAGGAAGWGTLCGALTVAGSVINMVTPLSDSMKIYNELIGWYTSTPLPTQRLDGVARIKKQLPSISDSPLCHASIAKWCSASGLKIGTPDHADRCAKLTGDVAGQTVALLNHYADNRFAASYKPSAKIQDCLGCHGKGGETGNVVSKMSCTGCHVPHEIE